MMQLQLYVIFGLLLMAAFFSAAETALIGMNRIKILTNIKNNHPKAKYLKVWIAEPNKLLATLSICINVVAISSSTIGAFISIDLARITKLDPSLTATLVAAVITIILIIFGEVSPKIFAIHNTERLGLFMIRPVVSIYRLISPLTDVFVKISSITIKLFGGQAATSIPVISSKDISAVISASEEQGYIDEQEKEMMSSILSFNDMQVKQAMVPRTSITAVDIAWGEDRILDMIMEAGYSRMPVYKDSLDNIVGILYTKDMLSMIKNRGLIIFHDIMRIPYFVPDTKNIGDLLKEFKKGKIHMAIIVDEFGGTAGLITLEDILEEIVGEIKDEYDTDERDVEDCGNSCYLAKGRVEIGALNAEPYKMDLPEEGGVNTISGFITALFGYVPKQGESITYGSVVFTIVKSDERKINKVKIEVHKTNV
jgi:putative hemolysin